MFKDKIVAFIGSGTMGEILIKVSLHGRLFDPQQIWATDIRPDQCTALAALYGIHTTTSNVEAAARADLVVLSVKPQVLPAVLHDLAGQIMPQAAVLSIVAGAPIDTVVQGLQHKAVARAMPNILAQISEGMTVWTATGEVTESQRQQIQALLQAMGQQVYVHEEKYLDMATAVTGSGPGYIFWVLEAMVDAAVYIGFSRPLAVQLVLQTVIGSARLASESNQHLAELRNMVTSPGGTTAEALYVFERYGLRAVFIEAIHAAYVKSQELSGVK